MNAIILIPCFIAYVVQPTVAEDGVAIVECKNSAAPPIRPKPSPVRCTDDPNSNCMAVYGPINEDATNHIPANAYKVHNNCIEPAFENLALQCARRCSLCYAKDDCAVFEANPNLCNEELVTERVRKDCPATCGFCEMLSACNDTIAHCRVIKQFLNCDDVQMKQQCMGTCGLNDCLPPVPTCKDEALDCHMVLTKGHCNRPDMIGANAIGRCKKTCEKC